MTRTRPLVCETSLTPQHQNITYGKRASNVYIVECFWSSVEPTAFAQCVVVSCGTHIRNYFRSSSTGNSLFMVVWKIHISVNQMVICVWRDNEWYAKTRFGIASPQYSTFLTPGQSSWATLQWVWWKSRPPPARQRWLTQSVWELHPLENLQLTGGQID